MLIVLAVVAMFIVAGCGGSSLTGKTWQLTAITEQVPAFQGVVPEADQARYTIQFNSDGTYNALADCNNMNGKYTTTGTGGMTIEPGAMPWKHRWIGNPVLSFIGRVFFRCPVQDFHCGLRGFSRAAILKLGVQSRHLVDRVEDESIRL